MASEQFIIQCDCGLRHRSARVAGHAATAAVCATRTERKTSALESTIAEFQLIRNTKDTGFGAVPNHASAGAAIAHSKGKLSSAEKQYKTQYSVEGSRAASSAVKGSRAAAASSSLPPLDTLCDLRGGEWPADEHRSTGHPGAIRAASGAFTTSMRRAEPASEERLASWERITCAASAANLASRPLTKSGLWPPEVLPDWADPSSIDRAANENAQAYVSEPAYRLGGENKKKVERAAAVSLARDTSEPSSRLHSQQYAALDPASIQRAIILQDAAQCRAAETIAEMVDRTTDFQRYYGTEPHPARARLSIRKKRTRQASDAPIADVRQSKEIKDQVTTLQTKLDEIDEQRQKDRGLLMEAAKRNVDALIHDIEQKIYGQALASPQKEPEETSVEHAISDLEAEEDADNDMIDVGGGQFIDPEVLEEVARLRIQPTLDDIDEWVEEQRAMEVEDCLDNEEKRRVRGLWSQRAADIRAEKRQQVQPSDWPGLDRMYDRADEKRAKEIEERLDKAERKRRKAVERQREAEIKLEKKQLIEGERVRKKRQRQTD